MFFGSPSHEGITHSILKKIININKNNFNFFFVDSYKRKVEPCVGCNCCYFAHICIYRDLDDVYKLLKNVTKIIIASPIYNCSFPSPLKAIFDRFQVFYNIKYKKIIKSKKVLLILTCGRKATAKLTDCIQLQTNCILKSIGS